MSRTRYNIFIVMLLAWAVLLVGDFIQVQAATDWGKHLRTMTSLWQLGHEYWYGVLNSSIVVIPGVTACWWTAKRYGGLSSHIGRAIVSLTVGTILWGFGNIIWFYSNSCNLLPGFMKCKAAIAIVYPSWPDVGYLAILPFSAAGLVFLTRVIAVPARDYLKLAWIPLVTAAVTVWFLGFAFGHYVNPHANAAEKVTSGVYILSDVILMSLALMLLVFSRRTTGGVFFPPMIGYAMGLVWLWVADMLFFPRIFFGEHTKLIPHSRIGHFLFQGYYNGDVSDLVYGVSIISITFGTFLFARAEQKMLLQMRELETSLLPLSSENGKGTDGSPV